MILVVAFSHLADAQDNRTTGSSLETSVGFRYSEGVLYTPISVAYNHFLTPWFMVGCGTGLYMSPFTYTYYRPAYYWSGYETPEMVSEHSYQSSNYGTVLPLFLEIEFRTPRYKWSAFFNVKVGASLGVSSGYIKEGKEFYENDYYGNPVYKEITIDEWDSFFFYPSVGFGYKNFSLSYGWMYYKNLNYSHVVLSYHFPLCKKSNE